MRAAMKDDTVVVDLLLRLKQPAETKSRGVSFSWGHKQRRSRSRLTASVSRCDRAVSTRCSPTTPLSWSGGASPSVTAEGCEDSSRYNNAARSKVLYFLLSIWIFRRFSFSSSEICFLLFDWKFYKRHVTLYFRGGAMWFPAVETVFVCVRHFCFRAKFLFVLTVLSLISLFTCQKPVAFRVFQSRISFSIFHWHSMILTENLSILLFLFFIYFFYEKNDELTETVWFVSLLFIFSFLLS